MKKIYNLLIIFIMSLPLNLKGDDDPTFLTLKVLSKDRFSVELNHKNVGYCSMEEYEKFFFDQKKVNKALNQICVKRNFSGVNSNYQISEKFTGNFQFYDNCVDTLKFNGREELTGKINYEVKFSCIELIDTSKTRTTTIQKENIPKLSEKKIIKNKISEESHNLKTSKKFENKTENKEEKTTLMSKEEFKSKANLQALDKKARLESEKKRRALLEKERRQKKIETEERKRAEEKLRKRKSKKKKKNWSLREKNKRKKKSKTRLIEQLKKSKKLIKIFLNAQMPTQSGITALVLGKEKWILMVFCQL